MMQGNLVSLVVSQRVALDVVKRLNLTDNPRTQEQFRNSGSFGRESIDEWMAESILPNVVPEFIPFTNVLAIKYKSGDPNQAALLANAFLASTIDASIAMKAASANQTASWFAPADRRPSQGVEPGARRSRGFPVPDEYGRADNRRRCRDRCAHVDIGTVDQCAGRTERPAESVEERCDRSLHGPIGSGSSTARRVEGETDRRAKPMITAKNAIGANNPKMVGASASITAIQKQIVEATAKMHEHLKDRIALLENQIASMEAEKTRRRRH